ncbi:MAG: hypothetical protein HDR04_03660 [Lachnospiraceae bacterium]|nr:hypothetical protein [Lachnospiraceae bacterium]
MVKDLELMKNITPLFEKRLVIWGAGYMGHLIIEDIVAMGAGSQGIYLCDSDSRLWGKTILGNEISSPDNVQQEMEKEGLEKCVILVTVLSIDAQNEILENIERLYGDDVDVYTKYAIEWGIYMNIKNPYIKKDFRDKMLIEHEKNKLLREEHSLQKDIALKYFALLPLHNDEIILIYQKGKVGSSSVYRSLRNYNRNVLHCHTLADIGEKEDDLCKLLNLKSGKIITLVRDPIARRISEMWENIASMERYSTNVDFSEIESYYFKKGFWHGDAEWFDEQIKTFFNIDIFEYPFDTEKGYTIIKQGNIEVLLLTLEKLNNLEEVIGNFLGIKSFQLSRNNVGKEKLYRFAFQSFKRNFTISEEEIEELYRKSKYMKYFYSEQEREEFYAKWVSHVKK